MADKKSREVYQPSEKAWFIREKIVERGLDHCRDLTPIQVDSIIGLANEYDNKNNPLSLKATVDVGDVLKGLKAVQREVRETLKMLKELENKQSVILNGKAISKAVYPYTTDGNEECSVCGSDVQTRTLKSDCGEVFTEKVCTKCGSDI